ncbi:hypothetical protein PUN28_010061 [Cardiocondyla obscurior]|uniref:Uncharacterized protein n=1 Tax=Cardiocondyla obscurior TaxID=286306 RepID=A0AAW2FM75_9HYME
MSNMLCISGNFWKFISPTTQAKDERSGISRVKPSCLIWLYYVGGNEPPGGHYVAIKCAMLQPLYFSYFSQSVIRYDMINLLRADCGINGVTGAEGREKGTDLVMRRHVPAGFVVVTSYRG